MTPGPCCDAWDRGGGEGVVVWGGRGVAGCRERGAIHLNHCQKIIIQQYYKDDPDGAGGMVLSGEVGSTRRKANVKPSAL